MRRNLVVQTVWVTTLTLTWARLPLRNGMKKNSRNAKPASRVYQALGVCIMTVRQ